jgi:hypothetical protein
MYVPDRGPESLSGNDVSNSLTRQSTTAERGACFR